MTQAPTIATGNAQSLQVTVDLGDVPAVLRESPKIAHFWIHGFLFASMRNHRVQWLKRKGVKFGRRGEGGSKAIRVFPVNQGPATPAEEDVVYRVHPAEQKAGSVDAARRGLAEMQAEAFAGSVVLRVHQFGEDIRSSKFMAIAVRTRPKTPEKWLQANPGKRLEWRPSKKKPGEGVLYEVERVRGRGRPRKGQPAPTRERLRLRFLLTRFVDMKPTLGMYETWDAQATERDALWAGAATRMHKQLNELDPRDF